MPKKMKSRFSRRDFFPDAADPHLFFRLHSRFFLDTPFRIGSDASMMVAAWMSGLFGEVSHFQHDISHPLR